jgi:CHAD domain-containing protein
VLDTSEIENVHAMRVATRRLRAAMEIFASAFPRKQHRVLL